GYDVSYGYGPGVYASYGYAPSYGYVGTTYASRSYASAPTYRYRSYANAPRSGRTYVASRPASGERAYGMAGTRRAYGMANGNGVSRTNISGISPRVNAGGPGMAAGRTQTGRGAHANAMSSGTTMQGGAAASPSGAAIERRR